MKYEFEIERYDNMVDIWYLQDDVSLSVLEGIPIESLEKLKKTIDNFLNE